MQNISVLGHYEYRAGAYLDQIDVADVGVDGLEGDGVVATTKGRIPC
jgi:hypothetical protein